MTLQPSKPSRPSRHDEWRQTLLAAWQERRAVPTFDWNSDHSRSFFQEIESYEEEAL